MFFATVFWSQGVDVPGLIARRSRRLWSWSKELYMKSSRNPRLLVSVILSCFWLVLSVPTWAQKDTGSIVGTVTDGAGAVVPNADVEVTDVERGQTFKTTTSDSGEFVASPLHVGRYNVTVAMAGFKKAVSETVELNVQGRIAINITLQVGQI